MANAAVRCRTISQHLNDLKKENFSLKLRIYFLEEKVQQKFEESDDDVHKRNIELKVEVESLKKELEEKQQLLDETLSRAERLFRQNEAELQRHLAERQQEVSHVQEVLETKVQLLQEEAELARAKAEHMALLADSEAQRRLALERELEKTEDRVMEELTQQKLLPGLQVEELQSREDPLEVSFAPLWEGGSLLWLVAVLLMRSFLIKPEVGQEPEPPRP
uniref:Centrosomin N-terminal motif 1 domain-containing protein n=1 Tax=Takifugu rubripes TaxID=31033 RepID=A0A3B5K2N0_TAKRU